MIRMGFLLRVPFKGHLTEACKEHVKTLNPQGPKRNP